MVASVFIVFYQMSFKILISVKIFFLTIRLPSLLRKHSIFFFANLKLLKGPNEILGYTSYTQYISIFKTSSDLPSWITSYT